MKQVEYINSIFLYNAIKNTLIHAENKIRIQIN